MTTIVFRDGIIAADSRTHGGGWLNPWDRMKLEELDGVVFALCGDWAALSALKSWVLSPEGPQPGGDCTLIVFRNGEVTVYSDGGFYVETAPFAAWGSGTPVAYGALHAGCSAEEAVRIASLVDPYTGGPITTMKLRENG